MSRCSCISWFTIWLSLDLPGSALPESKCLPVKVPGKPQDLDLPIGKDGKPVKYHCTGHTMKCRGKCTYCDQGCKSVRSKTVRLKYTCTTSDPDPNIKKVVPSRVKVVVDEECDCIGKYDEDKS